MPLDTTEFSIFPFSLQMGFQQFFRMVTGKKLFLLKIAEQGIHTGDQSTVGIYWFKYNAIPQ